ncbi:MAG: hypothetical protein ACRD1K_15595 [Acidimicrobiales bacterium]
MATTPSSRYLEAARPRTDLDTFIVMDHAVVDLADRRFFTGLDAPVQLHLLASLCAQAEVWLAEQVTVARATGMSWAAIGRLLGVTATVARQRYGATAGAGRRARPAASTGGPPLVR